MTRTFPTHEKQFTIVTSRIKCKSRMLVLVSSMTHEEETSRRLTSTDTSTFIMFFFSS